MTSIVQQICKESFHEGSLTIDNLIKAMDNLEYHPQLPPELWELIFRQLRMNHLLAVRQTCRQFKTIIDQSPSLMRRFLVRVPADESVDSENFKALLEMENLTSLDVKKLTISDENLQQIGESFPKLRNLALTVGTPEIPYVPIFLDTIPTLEHVAIWGTDCSLSNLNAAPEKQRIDFRSVKTKNLTKLQFAEVTIARLDLQEYFEQSSHLTEVNFFGCKFDSWSNILEVIGSLQCLERLSISVCRAEYGDFTLTKRFDRLKHLRFVGSNMMKDSFRKFISACTNVEEAELMFCRDFLDDNVMQVLCQKLRKLRKMSIFDCYITDAAIRYVQEHCQELKLLRIDSCYSVTAEARNILINSGVEVCTYISPYTAVRLNKL